MKTYCRPCTFLAQLVPLYWECLLARNNSKSAEFWLPSSGEVWTKILTYLWLAKKLYIWLGLFLYLLTRFLTLNGIVWLNIQPFRAGNAKVKSLRYPYLKMIFCNVVEPVLWVLAKAKLWIGIQVELFFINSIWNKNEKTCIKW